MESYIRIGSEPALRLRLLLKLILMLAILIHSEFFIIFVPYAGGVRMAPRIWTSSMQPLCIKWVPRPRIIQSQLRLTNPLCIIIRCGILTIHPSLNIRWSRDTAFICTAHLLHILHIILNIIFSTIWTILTHYFNSLFIYI